MKKIYNVVHHYDVDGGFGDAIGKEEILFATSSKKVAEEYVNKYSNNYVYDIPYSKLYRGLLKIDEQSIVDSWKDIPQEVIEWGEENKNEKDYNPDDYNQDYEYPDYPLD